MFRVNFRNLPNFYNQKWSTYFRVRNTDITFQQIKIIMGLFDKLFGGTKKDSNVEPPKNTNFTSSDKLMDEDQFWKIIQTTKVNSNGDFEEQQEKLA